jgi:prepilin-type N-terminal cleavage/methylation domain-containing protein
MTESQRGFTLIELVIALAVIAAIGATAVGALAAVSRAAMPNVMRDGALMVAENTLARARAAAAYVPLGDGVAPTDPADANLLRPTPTTFTAGVRIPSLAVCANAAPNADPAATVITVSASTAYAKNVFTVTVTYPRDRCNANSETASVILHETLAPPLYLPGHTITRNVADPTTM